MCRSDLTMSKSTDSFTTGVPLFIIQFFSTFFCVLILLPHDAVAICDCTVNQSMRAATDEFFTNKVNTIINDFTKVKQAEVAQHTKNAWDLQGSLTSSYKGNGGFANLTDFVLLGGLDLWLEQDLPPEVSTKQLNFLINATVINGSVWQSNHTWYSAMVNFTTYLQNEYVYALYEKLTSYFGSARPPVGIFGCQRYMLFHGINWVWNSTRNISNVQSLCNCMANESYSYKLNFTTVVSTIPLRFNFSLLKTDTELAVDDYLRRMYETTYLHSALGTGNLVNNTWKVSMDVYFLGTANETGSVFSERLQSMLTLPLLYTKGTAKLLAPPVVLNCKSRVVNYLSGSSYNYSIVNCATTTTSTSAVPSSRAVTNAPSTTPELTSLLNSTYILNSTLSSSSTTRSAPTTTSTAPSTTVSVTTMATNTSTTSLSTTTTIMQSTLVPTTSVPAIALATDSLSSVLPTTVITGGSGTLALDTTTENGTSASTATFAVYSTYQASSYGSSTSLGSISNTSTSKASTSATTLKSILDIATFDPDPFFKASVPIVTKIYNDEVLMKAMGTMKPLTEKADFYAITIPVAACIVLAALGCMLCLQMNWITPVKKDQLLETLPK